MLISRCRHSAPTRLCGGLQKVSAPRFGAAIAAVAFLLTGGLVAHPAQAAETAAVTTVSVASGNSADITTTTAGAAALQEFAAAVSEMSPAQTPKAMPIHRMCSLPHVAL
jgi:hypothetical protein